MFAILGSLVFAFGRLDFWRVFCQRLFFGNDAGNGEFLFFGTAHSKSNLCSQGSCCNIAFEFLFAAGCFGMYRRCFDCLA